MIILKPKTVGDGSKRNALLPYVPGPSLASAEANFFQVHFPLTFVAVGSDTETPNNAVTPNGQEAIILVYGRTLHAVQVSGAFVGTITVEVSLDDQMSVWNELDTFTAEDLKQYSGIFYALRVRITAYTSGSPLVIVQTQR